MDKKTIISLFDKYDMTEYRHFERIDPVHKLYFRPDLNAFALLHEMTMETDDEKNNLEHIMPNIIGSIDEKEIYLNIDIERWSTEWCPHQPFDDEILESLILRLVRCGVLYHSLFDCLYMRV